MVVKPIFGNWLSIERINSLDKYILVTMEEPWKIIEQKITNKPTYLKFNNNMAIDHLKTLALNFEYHLLENCSLIGIGGGTSCDTAKFLAWYLRDKFDLNIDLILIPSIISVDAFLCSSIAVRINSKVKYIGEIHPKEILIDYNLIQSAPPFLNRAGVSDTISITTALGDWRLAREEINEKFNQDVFNRAKKIVKNLMEARTEIKEVTEKGIKALVDGFYNEVVLCEEWGDARPEEGSEHFLAYCLESITHEHYIHGNLIGMNILISLFLQEEYAEFPIDEIKQFFEDIKINITPESQHISYNNIRKALKKIKKYVISEKLPYSIYNSSKLILNNKKIDEIIKFLKAI